MLKTVEFNKSVGTNLVALGLVIIGCFPTTYQTQIFSIGVFALSGAMTNWLAVYMLFERVPLLYGSGVIPNRFEAFKSAIKILIMEQFFTKENMQRFIEEEEQVLVEVFRPEQLIDTLDYDKLFNNLVDAIMNSSFGGMLGMVGGADALQPLKQPVVDKIKATLIEMTSTASFQSGIAASLDANKLTDDMIKKIEQVVDKRLDELTPQLVKQIVQRMIKQHLGWLVVWGGVFGGLIGYFMSFSPI